MISYLARRIGRKEREGQLKKDVGEKRRKCCEQKGVEILKAEASPDHIHILVENPTV